MIKGHRLNHAILLYVRRALLRVKALCVRFLTVQRVRYEPQTMTLIFIDPAETLKLPCTETRLYFARSLFRSFTTF